MDKVWTWKEIYIAALTSGRFDEFQCQTIANSTIIFMESNFVDCFIEAEKNEH